MKHNPLVNPHKTSKLVDAMRDILVCWNHHSLMQQMINWYATNWQGDPYAMVQRSQELSQLVKEVQQSSLIH